VEKSHTGSSKTATITQVQIEDCVTSDKVVDQL